MIKHITIILFSFLFYNQLQAQDFEKRDCEEKLVSGGGDATTIVFKNETKQELLFHWIDFQGNNKFFGKIPAKSSIEQNTFVGQYWLVTDLNKNCMGKYASLKGGKVIIPLEKSKSASPYLVFNTSAQASEQLRAHSLAPQIIGIYQNNQLYIAWKDFESEKIKISAYAPSNNTFMPIWIKNVPQGLDILAGFAGDGQNLYCMTAIDENLSENLNILGYRSNILNMSKLDKNGNLIWGKNLNTKTLMNSPVFSPTIAGTADLSFGNGKLCLIYAGNTLPDNNNIRHQKASYLILDAETGEGTKENNGETSWRHSFDQRILFDGQDFVILDLGDAGWYMPAGGITARKIVLEENSIKMPAQAEGVFVYARQSETAGSQNYSFISMGDIAVGENGYSVLFSSEKTNQNKMREGWKEPILEPRNLGFVHIVKDFQLVKDGNLKSQYENRPDEGNTFVDYQKGGISLINITENIVDTRQKNPKAQPGGETFTRPDKPNLKFKTASVAWLTNFQVGADFLSVERPKMIKIAPQKYLAVWEEWSVKPKANTQPEVNYQSTQVMLLDEYGNILKPKQKIQARLNPNGSDKLFLLDNKAAWIASDNNQLIINILDEDLNLQMMKLDY
jgi:hypothetical protein